MVSYYPLNGNSNAVVGTSFSGASAGSFVANHHGVSDFAQYFAGAELISAAGGGGLDGLGAGTFALWVQWTGMQVIGFIQLWGAAISRQSDGVFSNDILGLNGPDPASATLAYYHSNSCPNLAGVTPVGLSTWHFVAVIWNGSVDSLYMDGNLEASGSCGGLDSNGAIPLTVGGWTGTGGDSMIGSISDLVVWNQVLTETQLVNLESHLSISAFCGRASHHAPYTTQAHTPDRTHA